VIRKLISLLAVLVLLSLTSTAQEIDEPGSDFVREHFTKYEHRITMRDGARLFTAVYVPKICEEPYPILLKRTPYSVRPYGVDHYPDSLGPSDHACLVVPVRGMLKHKVVPNGTSSSRSP